MTRRRAVPIGKTESPVNGPFGPFEGGGTVSPVKLLKEWRLSGLKGTVCHDPEFRAQIDERLKSLNSLMRFPLGNRESVALLEHDLLNTFPKAAIQQLRHGPHTVLQTRGVGRSKRLLHRRVGAQAEEQQEIDELLGVFTDPRLDEGPDALWPASRVA